MEDLIVLNQIPNMVSGHLDALVRKARLVIAFSDSLSDLVW